MTAADDAALAGLATRARREQARRVAEACAAHGLDAVLIEADGVARVLCRTSVTAEFLDGPAAGQVRRALAAVAHGEVIP